MIGAIAAATVLHVVASGTGSRGKSPLGCSQKDPILRVHQSDSCVHFREIGTQQSAPWDDRHGKVVIARPPRLTTLGSP